MSVLELIRQNRSTRRFAQDRPVPMAVLESLVEAARCSASAGNLQPLRYILCNDPERNGVIFSRVGWAAYLPHWQGPEEGERPAAYVIVCADMEQGASAELTHLDCGIAAQSMLLAAREQGVAGCMLGSVNRDKLTQDLGLDPGLHILLAVALGEPAETCVLEPMQEGDVQYWRDDASVHHVPKRDISELILNRFGE